MITVEQLEESSKIPVRMWVGNCYTMACEAADLIEGSKPVYGHFRGDVHPKSVFSRVAVAGWVQHGWVVLPDGKILDPTRWVFECKKPYIFIGTTGVEYDEGGNTLRRLILEPAPKFDPEDRVVNIKKEMCPSDTWTFIEEVFQLQDQFVYDEYSPGDITVFQLHWLANQDPKDLRGYAGIIYGMLERLNMKGFIPIDNYRRVKNGRV